MEQVNGLIFRRIDLITNNYKARFQICKKKTIEMFPKLVSIVYPVKRSFFVTARVDVGIA